MSEPAKILVADDEPDIVDLLVFVLEREGYATERAVNGREALELAVADPPALLIVDLMMPLMTGIEVTEQLRECGHEHPILLLTASVQDEYVAEAAASGVNEQMRKPFQPRHLIESVKTLLARGAKAS